MPQRNMRVTNMQMKQGRTGTPYVVFTLYDLQTGQTFDATSFDPFNQQWMNQDVLVELRQKGQWTNIDKIQFANQPQMGAPNPGGMPQPGTSTPPQFTQPPQQAPSQVPPQAPPTSPFPQGQAGALVPAQPANSSGMSRKDILMARMSALRGSTEVVAQQILIMAQAGNAPTQDLVNEMIQNYADQNLIYILKNELPGDGDIPF